MRRFLGSPLTGVGVSNVATYVPSVDTFITPHNSFISIALGSGLVPFILFLVYWICAIKVALRAGAARFIDAPFRIPLLTYTFLIELGSAGAFMAPWAVLALCLALAGGVRQRTGSLMLSEQYSAFLRQSRRSSWPPIPVRSSAED